MNGDKFWNLLAKKLSREASADEIAELEALIKAHPDLGFSAQHLTDLWTLKQDEAHTDVENAFQKHLNKLQINTDAGVPQQDVSKQKSRKRIVVLGFALTCLLAASWILFRKNPQGEKALSQKAEIYTRQGARTKLSLPDGSVVWLNAGSKITYEPDFGNTNRNATLTGEAFFDVKKASIPFIIKTAALQIKVLGTAFNVKAYPNEKTVETSLIRGRVEITLNNRPGELIILKPNEKLVVANTAVKKVRSNQTATPIVVLRELTHINDSMLAETSWVENKLVFQDESLEEVALKMERWYNVKIDINDESLAQLHVGGGPFENETIEQALTALQIAFNFKFTKQGNHIIITR